MAVENVPSLLQVDVVGGEESELALALAEPPTLVHLKFCTDGGHMLRKRNSAPWEIGNPPEVTLTEGLCTHKQARHKCEHFPLESER